MSKYLIHTTEVYNISTVPEVEQFHEELRNDPSFSLVSFGYKTKYIKEKGDVIDEYQLVSVKKAFNEEKNPCVSVDISYEVE